MKSCPAQQTFCTPKWFNQRFSIWFQYCEKISHFDFNCRMVHHQSSQWTKVCKDTSHEMNGHPGNDPCIAVMALRLLNYTRSRFGGWGANLGLTGLEGTDVSSALSWIAVAAVEDRASASAIMQLQMGVFNCVAQAWFQWDFIQRWRQKVLLYLSPETLSSRSCSADWINVRVLQISSHCPLTLWGLPI